ncbi:uncharacterized protein LOC105180945 [Harpegnathos saltator]|uniref:Uncharacterized protein n=1 Tax=Harpegnathos saltator TaxID=610380 RepID=E2BBD4_HARSA|nr:uncharacterized protein LOC105180945 [Harpegnathos saltator]XP_011135614.1 uncharacterized protein LOC105180945 [Harpegnathos saltator]XP_011135616.1 uncharacterized protein LOC105180945 [Harpegnathos saltator]XP_011135617.1 uncharacterized protein LOC105180945 [Harpegnathos saltator]XP_025153547.1 uncharacterized protein LOC105180945 [Harpegnathos saltator]XP_025153548.1 uncharacterized protein LOC105180945 [Harpegnathos saltator]XP_025153549.1 uncharacterized protein LOC105180945 [Harpeg
MFATPYLNAIQKLPGDTAKEKWKWLWKLSEDQQNASGDIDQLSSELQPLLHVNVAIKQKIYEDVASALKSDDLTVVRRALQASWFFDGSHKDVVNVEYFCKHIFPYVSMNTRMHIIKKFALKLKDPQFAQQMFIEVEHIFGIQQALPLIVMCDEDFIYRTIVEKSIKLPMTIAKKIFRKNIDFMVRYLNSPDIWKGFVMDDHFQVDINDYKSLLPTLVKKRPAAFAKIYERYYGRTSLYIKLSNTCVNAFLKNGVEYLIRKPSLFINRLIPLDKIHATIIEKIIPNLLPEKIDKFSVNAVLEYLKHYPENKAFDLLCRSYWEKYNSDILHTPRNVTSKLLKIMPVKERIKHARIKMKQDELRDVKGTDVTEYEDAWICYLPTAESIPSLKNSIKTATTTRERLGLLLRMIYTCKVNNDEEAFIDYLKYFLDRHKNEEIWAFDQMLDTIASLYKVYSLNENVYSVLNDIVVTFYVKYGYVSRDILLGLIHYRLQRDMPIVEQIKMLIDTLMHGYPQTVKFQYIFQKNPDYVRQCISVCMEVLEEKNKTEDWKIRTKNLLLDLVFAIYYLNEEYKKSRTEVKFMTVRDYPWLLPALFANTQVLGEYYYNKDVVELFRKYEPELYSFWFVNKEDRYKNDVETGAVMGTLKRDPQSILDNWKMYLCACQVHDRRKNMHRFVRAIRWYKDLPIRFLDYCRDKWQQNKNPSYLIIMTLLIRGDTAAKLVEPLIPTQVYCPKSHAGDLREDYLLVRTIPLVMKLANPLVTPELVVRLCEANMPVALMALMYMCKRYPLPKVISLAENFSDKRVSIMKHGIRIMYLVASLQQLEDFIPSIWQKIKHHSIRTVLLTIVQNLLLKDPNDHSWSLFKKVISMMIVEKNLSLLPELNPIDISDMYTMEYIELMLNLIDSMLANGVEIEKVRKCISSILEMLARQTKTDLPIRYVEKLLPEYLFHQIENVASAATKFAVNLCLSLAPTDPMYKTRMEIFSDVFKEKVQRNWGKCHQKKSDFYPINYAVSEFIKNFAITASREKCYISRISEMIELFLSVLTPQKEPRSYLLLVYAQDWLTSTSLEQYGLKLSARMPNLIETFSLMFMPNMIDIFKYHLFSTVNMKNWDKFNNLKIDFTLDVVNGLIETGNVESCFMAVNLLVEYMPCRNVRYCGLIEKLLNMNHSGITSLLNKHKNQVSYHNAKFDIDD